MAEVFERRPPEYYLARLHWQPDAFDDAVAGSTVTHPAEHRGHGHGSGLLAIAKTTAIARSWRGLLSLVDLTNQPMVQTMTRSGFSPDSHPWHKWHYLRET